MFKCLMGFLLILPASASVAQSISFAPTLEEAGWDTINVPEQEPNDAQVDADGILTVTSNGTVSFLVREVQAPEHAVLSWEWQTAASFPARNLDIPGQDDRPAAVHVWFPEPSKDLFSWLGGGLKDLLGYPVFGKAITYVWGAEAPADTLMPNPFMDDGEGVMILLRPDSTPMQEWITERRDLAQDYARAFGTPVKAAAYIALSADTDDTGARAQFRIRNVSLEQGAD